VPCKKRTATYYVILSVHLKSGWIREVPCKKRIATYYVILSVHQQIIHLKHNSNDPKV